MFEMPVVYLKRGGEMNDDPDPTKQGEQDLTDDAVAAAEQHQQAEEVADEDEPIVIHDAQTGTTEERPAQ